MIALILLALLVLILFVAGFTLPLFVVAAAVSVIAWILGSIRYRREHRDRYHQGRREGWHRW
ncbi:hydrophobic protein [Yinghuangia soli]|uniref:Hydrophobic protein n=1 Tax=Yinghuangia soli TaxID=2908204 RepID=A0AA41U145_9ACTN|nr:hydrophobic protein [Yinghuangia soli]MCF2529261.1 hydrophobic protein [Yinghuangia soli]